MASGDDLVEYDNEEIGVISREYWNVHRNANCVRLIQTHAKVPFSAQKEKDKDLQEIGGGGGS